MSKNRPWTPHEEAIILKHYPTEGVEGCLKLLPDDRNYGSVQNKACRMKVHMLDVVKNKRNSEGQKRRLAMPKPEEIRTAFEEVSREYLQACSIWQVGYRVAKMTGRLGDYQ